MRRSLIASSVCVVILTAMAQFAAAGTLVYEPFNTGGSNYAVASLPGQTAVGSGLTGTWAGMWPGTSSTNPAVVSSGLSLPGYVSAGGAEQGGNGVWTWTGTNVSAAVTAATAGPTVYFSYLTKRPAGGTADNSVSRLALIATYGGRDHQVAIGVNTGAYYAETMTNMPWEGIYNMTSGGSYTDDTTVLVIGKANTTGGVTTVSVWGNPADFSSEAAAGAATTTASAAVLDGIHGITSIGLLDSYDGSQRMYSDEIRVGTSWADVIPSAVPEPSAVVLLALGLIGLLCYAWRKRK